MEKLHVDLGMDSYDIIFERSFGRLAEAMAEISAPKKLLIVTDTNVQGLYGEVVRKTLIQAGHEVGLYAFPAGEAHKNMDAILGICQACVERELDRKSMIVALGGGVVGDMAGFAAAIYMRGIPFVQVPTTLLSQSDSSVGGKTGVDFGDSKNLLGAFHQPRLVYINVAALKTLPSEEFISGMGEVIKHGVIQDPEFFGYIQKNRDKIKGLDEDVLMKMAKTNCAIKARVVMEDERENGLRAILNFGHTIGHGVESALDFSMTHGQCVALGMCAAGYLAVKRGILKPAVLEELETVLREYGFAVRAELPSFETVYAFMAKDKKKAEGRLKFILPTALGAVVSVTDVSRDEIEAAVNYINVGKE